MLRKQCIFTFFVIIFRIFCDCTYGHNNWNYKQQENNKEYYDYQLPITKTQYEYRTIQTGSAIVPHRGQKVYIGPNHNLTKNYLAKIDTTILTHRKRFRRPINTCVKCPPEKMVIAKKRLDGVLIEPPPALTCYTNHPFSKALYEVETLFGSKFMFVLPQGTHHFIAKIINRKTGNTDQTCLLKYKVIIRQCPKYHTENWNLKIKCDLGNIWGSECTFLCKNGGILSHQRSVVCGDDLTWVGVEPFCYNKNEHHNIDNKTSCELPIPPPNGKFSCDIINSDPHHDNDLYSPNGSFCQINCNKRFEIPKYLERYASFYCENGRWNSTMIDFCQRKM